MALPPPSADSIALVTGASSGIGAEIARELARRGHGVLLVARRRERLEELAGELSAAHGVRVEICAADLSTSRGRGALAGVITRLGAEVEILVNNAGFGGHGDFAEQERSTEIDMVRLNVEAVTDLLARYLPAMVERDRGAVINVASTAAFQPLPGSATYAATKAFVLNLGEAVHQELKGTGVTLTTVCPGPVETEFADVAGIDKLSESAPEIVWTSAAQVAAEAVAAAESGKRAIIPGRLNQLTALAGRHAPRFASLPLIERVWGRG